MTADFTGAGDSLGAASRWAGGAWTEERSWRWCVNDLGGTLMDENISRAAGAAHGQGMEPDDFAALVAPLGRPLRQRTTLYQPASPRTTDAFDTPRHPIAVSDG